ncbi:MAG: tyrosine-type recombinase/integrase [Candidatus Acidiferrales bacterium]
MQTNKLLTMPKPKTAKKSRKPSLRVRGQGSLFLRGETFWMELNWKGERFRRSLETTDRETALIKLDDEVAAIRAGELPKRFDPITVQAMYDEWLLYVETNCKPRTQEDYRSRWTVHLKTFFGSMLATQVTRDKVTAYLHSRMKEGATLCTRNREQRVLMMIFNHNRSKIPADRFPQFPKMQSERAHVRRGRLSDEDFATLRQRLDAPQLFWLKAFLTLTFKYGFRKGELLKAKCGYFDAKAATLALPPFTTKNKQPRVVDLLPEGEIFKMLQQLTAGRGPEAALFTRNARPVRDFRGEWKKQTEGMRGGSGKDGSVTIHDLRRSAITAMSEKGITASQAGTHLTPDVFSRYISRNLTERRKTAKLIEGD